MKYNAPELEVVELETSDVILVSPDDNTSGGNNNVVQPGGGLGTPDEEL